MKKLVLFLFISAFAIIKLQAENTVEYLCDQYVVDLNSEVNCKLNIINPTNQVFSLIPTSSYTTLSFFSAETNEWFHYLDLRDNKKELLSIGDFKIRFLGSNNYKPVISFYIKSKIIGQVYRSNAKDFWVGNYLLEYITSLNNNLGKNTLQSLTEPANKIDSQVIKEEVSDNKSVSVVLLLAIPALLIFIGFLVIKYSNAKFKKVDSGNNNNDYNIDSLIGSGKDSATDWFR